MSLEESNTSTAVAAPIAESTNSSESTPVAAVAPVASTTVATETKSNGPEIKEEPVKPAEVKEEEKVTATKQTQPTERPATTRSDYSYSYPPQTQQQNFFGTSQYELPYPFFLHNNFLMLFIFIGMLFTLIGGIMSGSAIISANNDIYGASVIAISIGLFTISTFLILAALFRDDVNHFVRLGFLITGAIAIFGLILYSRFGVAIF